MSKQPTSEDTREQDKRPGLTKDGELALGDVVRAVWREKWWIMFTTFLVMAITAGCGQMPRTDVTQVEAKPEIIQSAVRFQKEYILFVGDQIEVAVWRVPEVSRQVTIRADGMISLPLLQDVPAAGLTALSGSTPANPHCFCSIGICLVIRLAFSA